MLHGAIDIIHLDQVKVYNIYDGAYVHAGHESGHTHV